MTVTVKWGRIFAATICHPNPQNTHAVKFMNDPTNATELIMQTLMGGLAKSLPSLSRMDIKRRNAASQVPISLILQQQAVCSICSLRAPNQSSPKS